MRGSAAVLQTVRGPYRSAGSGGDLLVVRFAGVYTFSTMKELNYSDPAYNEAMSHYLAGDWEAAEPHFVDLCVKYEKSTFVRLILGNIYYSLGKLDAAIEKYQEAVFVDPEFGLAYYQLGVCFYRKGHLNRALEAFRMVAGTKQNHAMASYYIGLINMYLGKDEQAAEGFHRFKEQSPESMIANLYLGQLKLKVKDYKGALGPLLELVERTPQFAEVHYMLGTVYFGMHDNTRAVQCFRRALQINPEDERSKAKLTLLTDMQFT